MKLRNDFSTKENFRDIEDYLSTKIFEVENFIHETRIQGTFDLEEEFYRRRTLLKRIADGLAWKILDYDTHVIHGCSIGHSPGFMYGKESYLYERNIVRAAYQIPTINYAYQCDITNFLRVSVIML